MNRKKRGTQNFLIHDTDDVNPNDVTDSEDEYSENEKTLLREVRTRRTSENYDSDDPVYGVDVNNDTESEDNDSMKSDIEGLEDNSDLPNERAWGKQKKAYYSTDFVDQDYASTNQKDLETAELEEQEARNIQERLVEHMDDADFGFEFLQTVKESDTLDNEEIVKMDLTRLTQRQKQVLTMKENPELLPLMNDLKECMKETRDILMPFLQLVDSNSLPNNPAISFLKIKYELVLNYCVNIIFYLMLKAKRSPTKNHPVMKRLAQYRQLLNQLQSGQGNLLEEAAKMLKAANRGQQLYFMMDDSDYSQLESIRQKPMASENKKEAKKTLAKNISHLNKPETQGTLGEEKRSITYQIAKNKGLMPHRKREQRNPRVKHRNKYRKAIIRRKGAVREVRKELTRYAGEMSGIKASVKKSVKLKY